MYSRSFFLLIALSTYSAAVSTGGDSLQPRTYDQFLTEIFTEVYPCGGIAPHEDTAGDINAFRKCSDMCKQYGHQYAHQNGCYNFTEAIAHGMFRQISFVSEPLDWPVLPQNFTVTDCAVECFDNPECIAWSYGPPYTTADPDIYPNSSLPLTNTKVSCKIITPGMLRASIVDQTRGGKEGQFGNCNGYGYYVKNDTWENFEYHGRYDFSLAFSCSVGAFITYRPFDENCRLFDPFGFADAPPVQPRAAGITRINSTEVAFTDHIVSKTISASTSISELKSTRSGNTSTTVTECQAEIISSMEDWTKDCQEKCESFGPGGTLAAYCANSNSDASALIACISKLTSYCSKRS